MHLGHRVPGLDLAGLELQPAYAELARRNAERNRIAAEFHEGDIDRMPSSLRREFDHVIANPPYYHAGGSPSPVAARSRAMRVDTPLSDWVAAAARRLRPGGWMTSICGSDGLPEVVSASLRSWAPPQSCHLPRAKVDPRSASSSRPERGAAPLFGCLLPSSSTRVRPMTGTAKAIRRRPTRNPELVAAVSDAGGMGIVQPISLTYVHGHDFREGLRLIFKLSSGKPIGLNALIEASSETYKRRMDQWVDIALEEGVRFFVTSLGNPRWIVERAHAAGAVVYHDATEKRFAEKAMDANVDGLIAVNRHAGGHLGGLAKTELFLELQEFGVPVVCAGGIGDEAEFLCALDIGYAGA